MNCPKHNVVMTQLFTSWICDVCNPVPSRSQPILLIPDWWIGLCDSWMKLQASQILDKIQDRYGQVPRFTPRIGSGREADNLSDHVFGLTLFDDPAGPLCNRPYVSVEIRAWLPQEDTYTGMRIIVIKNDKSEVDGLHTKLLGAIRDWSNQMFVDF